MKRAHSRARTPVRDNKRGKYINLSFDEAISQGKFLLRLLIPAHLGGAIIGKGGEIVRCVGHKYNAIISVTDKNTPERSVSIIADPDAVVDCFHEILRLISQSDKKYVEVRLLVHRSHVGLVIGTKGANIKAINEAFNTKINIFNEFCPQSTDRVACIKGTEDGIVKTVTSFIEDLSKHPIKSHEQNYNVANHDPNLVDLYGGYGSRNRFDRSFMSADQIRAQQFQQTPGRHNINMAQPTPKPAKDPSYGRRAFSQAPQSPPRRGRSPRRVEDRNERWSRPSTPFYKEDFLRDRQTNKIEMAIPREVTKKVIGSSGEVLTRIEKESGVSIHLGVTMYGTQEQLTVAQMLIKLSAKNEPTRHYSDESLIHNRNLNQASYGRPTDNMQYYMEEIIREDNVVTFFDD